MIFYLTKTEKERMKMGRPQKPNQKKVTITLPEEAAITLEYLVRAGYARTKSDLIMQMMNEFEKNNIKTLEKRVSWKKFVDKRDAMKGDLVDDLFEDTNVEQ